MIYSWIKSCIHEALSHYRLLVQIIHEILILLEYHFVILDWFQQCNRSFCERSSEKVIHSNTSCTREHHIFGDIYFCLLFTEEIGRRFDFHVHNILYNAKIKRNFHENERCIIWLNSTAFYCLRHILIWAIKWESSKIIWILWEWNQLILFSHS